MGDCTLTLFKLFCSYFVLSLLAGVIVGAFGYETFAFRWLFTPPLLMVLVAGVSLFLAIMWWS